MCTVSIIYHPGHVQECDMLYLCGGNVINPPEFLQHLHQLSHCESPDSPAE